MESIFPDANFSLVLRSRDRERRRSKSRDKERERDRDNRKSRRSRSREKKHRDRSRESDRRRRSSRSPSSHQSLPQVPVASPPNNHMNILGFDNGASAAANNFMPPRNFLNLFSGTQDLALMEQELALNPHLLQRMAQDTDLGAQLMKFNSELAGLGSNSNSLSLANEKQMPSLMNMVVTQTSYEASNSCDNSQDAQSGFCFAVSYQECCD